MNDTDAPVSPTPLPVTPVIEYAHTQANLKPASLRQAGWTLWGSVIAIAVGVGFLLLYRLTAWEGLTGLGLFWLVFGGAIVSVNALVALCLLFIVKARAPNGVIARKRYAWALAICFAGYPIAFGCMALGSKWMDGPHFRLEVVNTTAVNLDSVTAHFDDGDVTVGPVRAGGSARSWLKWYNHSGPLYITTRRGNDAVRKMDRIDCNKYHLQQPIYTVHVEDHELPR